jgi:hypothetical protein
MFAEPKNTPVGEINHQTGATSPQSRHAKCPHSALKK